MSAMPTTESLALVTGEMVVLLPEKKGILLEKQLLERKLSSVWTC